MRKTLATCTLAGVVGLTGVAGTVLLPPALSYAATGDSSALESRVSSIRDALAGLVTDGTLTQSQADAVATRLAESPPRGLGPHHGPGRGRGLHLEALESLGITAEEVRAAAEAGTTLAELAQQQGVSEDRLVSALVAAHEQRLAEAVADGRLTQAEADERAAGAEARIRERLDDPLRAKGDRHHRHVPGAAPTASPGAEPDA